MSPSNQRAFKFYKAMGFVEIARADDDLILGRPLASVHRVVSTHAVGTTSRFPGVFLRERLVI